MLIRKPTLCVCAHTFCPLNAFRANTCRVPFLQTPPKSPTQPHLKRAERNKHLPNHAKLPTCHSSHPVGKKLYMQHVSIYLILLLRHVGARHAAYIPNYVRGGFSKFRWSTFSVLGRPRMHHTHCTYRRRAESILNSADTSFVWVCCVLVDVGWLDARRAEISCMRAK